MAIFLMILDVLVCIGLIAVIVMQSSKSAGVSGVIGGASEQFFGKKKGMDELLSKITIVLGAIFFVLTFIICAVLL
ncbi:MAG: preprotein translocase subunit SecG [Firmicutes bacterium]|jgi:preprotein translocase subunit SecG|nr:preprotein translocase subunit SecG [Bacillota bacterium]